MLPNKDDMIASFSLSYGNVTKSWGIQIPLSKIKGKKDLHKILNVINDPDSMFDTAAKEMSACFAYHMNVKDELENDILVRIQLISPTTTNASEREYTLLREGETSRDLYDKLLIKIEGMKEKIASQIRGYEICKIILS